MLRGGLATDTLRCLSFAILMFNETRGTSEEEATKHGPTFYASALGNDCAETKERGCAFVRLLLFVSKLTIAPSAQTNPCHCGLPGGTPFKPFAVCLKKQGDCAIPFTEAVLLV